MKNSRQKKKIPYGIYCHGLNEKGEHILCPHWERENSGAVRCRFLGISDSEEETLLWDQCKECIVHERVPARVIKAYIRNTGGTVKQYRRFKKQESF